MGGQIAVESKIGIGTTFTIRIATLYKAQDQTEATLERLLHSSSEGSGSFSSSASGLDMFRTGSIP